MKLSKALCRDAKALWRNVNKAVLVLLLLSTALSGCALSPGGREAAVKDVSAAAGGPGNARIKFMYIRNSVDFDKILSEYNSKTSASFQIDAVSVPADKYDETLNALFTSGEGPDVFELGKEWIAGYIAKGWLYNLKSSVSDTMLKEYPDWIYQYIPEPDAGNCLYTLPTGQLTVRLLYNRTLFRQAGLDPDAPPETLAELESYAQRITDTLKGYKKYGFALNAGDGAECFEKFLEAANTCSGVNYFDYSKLKYDLDVYIPWFRAIREMKENESMLPGETVLKNNMALSQFAEGNIGMMYADFNAVCTLEMLRLNSSRTCDWAAALPPALDDSSRGRGKASIIPTGFYCVNADTGNIRSAVRLWRFLYSTENLRNMYSRCYILPALGEIRDDSGYMPDIKNFSAFLPGKDDTVYPATGFNTNDWSRFDAYMEALNGAKPVDEILKSESDNLNFLLLPFLSNEQIYKGNPSFNWRDPLKR